MTKIARHIFAGEIIPPGDGVTVVASLNMFSQASAPIRVPAGSTLEECVRAAQDAYAGPRPHRVSVALGDDFVPEEFWKRIRVKPGAFVAVRGVPGGGGDSTRTFLLLAVAAAALAASVFLPGSTLPLIGLVGKGLAAAITIGISVGGSLLVNSMFPPRPPVLQTKTGAAASPTYSISGGSNDADPFGPIPFVLGKHRIFPKQAARPYTELDGKNQYLFGLYCWGYGNVNVTDLKIGETPLGNFDEVTVQTDTSFDSEAESITLFPGQVIEEQLSIALEKSSDDNDWHTRTTAENCDRIAVDIAFPAGVYQIDKDTNRRTEYTAKVAAQYRPVDTTAWKSFANQIDITSKKPSAIRLTMAQAVTRGQYEVRDAKGKRDYDGDNLVSEQTVWTALRSYRNVAPISFDEILAVTALKIKATGQLNGTVSALNGIVESRQLSYNGSSWVADQASQNPADLLRYALQGPFNKKPVADAQIDLAKIEAWWAYCHAKGYTFNMVRDFRASVWDCASDIAAAGRAIVCFVDGKWSVVYDDPDAAVVGHYTPRNSRGFTEERQYLRPPHAFRVRFVNADNGYKEDERIVYDDGYSAANATLFEQIEFPGVTDADLNWKHARFHIAQARLRPSNYSLIVAREHFRNTVGDRVRVQHYLPLWGLVSGRVKAVDGSNVTLDEPVPMEIGKSYAIRITQPGTGTSFTRAVLTAPGIGKAVVLSGSGTAPAADDLFSFGEAGLETVILRIKKISYLDEAEAKLTLQDDAPAISSADTGTIPAFSSQITLPPDPSGLAPRVTVTEHAPALGETPSTGAHLSWELPTGSIVGTPLPGFLGGAGPSLIPLGVLVQFKPSDEDEWDDHGFFAVPNFSTLIQNLTAGRWSFRAQTVFNSGPPSTFTEVADVQITGVEATPGDVQNLKLSANGDFLSLSWDPVTTAGVDHYVVRFAPVLTGADWSSAQIVADGIVGTTTLLPTLSGTYLVKAVNASGAESAVAAEFASAAAGLRGLNAIETLQEDPAWDGALDGVEIDGDNLRLTAVESVLDWPDITTITSDYWTTQFPNEGLFHPDLVDLGEVYTSRVTANISAFGENVDAANYVGSWGYIGLLGFIGGENNSGWAARYEERHASDFDDTTEICLNFNGADAGTAIVDDRGTHAWTAVGNAQLDTAEKRFGGASLKCDGAGDSVETPQSTDLDFGSDDFCVEGWFSLNGGDSSALPIACKSQSAFGTPSATGWYLYRLNSGGVLVGGVSDGSTLHQVTGSSSRLAGSGWHHAEFSRTGDTVYLFVDGVLEDTEAFSGSVNAISAKTTLSAFGEAGSSFNGWLDGWRIATGEGCGGHTEDFDLPTSAPHPFAFTEWAEIKAAQDYTFRAIDRRLRLISITPNVRPVIDTASLVIDMPDELRGGSDITIGSDGMRVDFDPPFRVFDFGKDGVAISHQVLDDAVRILVTDADETGFNVTAKNAAGSFVSGQKFSYNAKGAGKQLS